MDTDIFCEKNNDCAPHIELIVNSMTLRFKNDTHENTQPTFVHGIEFSLPILLHEWEKDCNRNNIYVFKVFIQNIQQYCQQSGVPFPERTLIYHDLTAFSGNETSDEIVIRQAYV